MRFTWGQLKWKVNLKLFMKFLKKEMESFSFKNWTQNLEWFYGCLHWNIFWKQIIEFGQWSETFCWAPDANGRGKSEAIVGLRKKMVKWWHYFGAFSSTFSSVLLPKRPISWKTNEIWRAANGTALSANESANWVPLTSIMDNGSGRTQIFDFHTMFR